MKKSLLLSAAILTMSAIYAQTPASLQSEIAMDNRVEGILNKEKRADRKEIRKLKGPEVSVQSKNAFIVDFGDIPGTTWSRLDNYDEATFTKGGAPISAFYDIDATLVGTTQAKTYADIPANAQKTIAKDYQGYTPGDVLKYDDNEANDTDMILYGNQFADKDSYFVELAKDNKKIVVQVTMDGEVSYYTRLK